MEIQNYQHQHRRWVEGDSEAGEQFISRNLPSLKATIHRDLVDKSEAESVLNDVVRYIEANKDRFDSCKDYGHFVALMHWIAKRRVIDANRAVSRRRRREKHTTSEHLNRVHAPIDRFAEMHETLVQLELACSKLDSRLWEVISLRFFTTMTLDEIANELGISAGRAKWYIEKGLRQLRESMKGCEPF